MLLYRAEVARERNRQADLVQLIATAYGGCKTEKGHRAMRELMQALRERE